MKTRINPRQISIATPEQATPHDYWITLVVVVGLSSFSLMCFATAIAKFSTVLTLTMQPQVPEMVTREALSHLD